VIFGAVAISLVPAVVVPVVVTRGKSLPPTNTNPCPKGTTNPNCG